MKLRAAPRENAMRTDSTDLSLNELHRSPKCAERIATAVLAKAVGGRYPIQEPLADGVHP